MPNARKPVQNVEFRIKNSENPHNSELSTLNSPKGFTLIELLVAITILAVIATIGLATYSKAQITARDSRRIQDLRAVQTALTLYFQSQDPHAYPAVSTWSSLQSALYPTYINQMPTDPTNSGSYQYTYNGSSSTYELCDGLENPSATTGKDGITDSKPGLCPTGGTAVRWIDLTNP